MNKYISQVISFVFLLGLSTTVLCQTKMIISLSARDLPNFDIWDGPPDSYLILTNSTTGTFFGQTDVQGNTQNPNWTTVFPVNYTGGVSQKLKFDLYDDDFAVDPDDYLGYAEVLLIDIIGAFGGILERPLIGNASPGRLIIRATIN